MSSSTLSFVICETVAAITTHLRRVTSKQPLNVSGHRRGVKHALRRQRGMGIHGSRCEIWVAASPHDAATAGRRPRISRSTSVRDALLSFAERPNENRRL